MAEKNKELRIHISATADPAVEAAYQRLLKGWRDVRDATSDPLQLSAEFKSEALAQAAADVRKRFQAELDKTKLRVQAEFIAPDVRRLAGLRSADAPRLQRAAILQSSLHENLSALSQEDFDARSSERRARIVRERDSEVATKTGLVPEVAEEPAHVAARQAETIRQREAEEQRRRDVLRRSILASNVPAAKTRNEGVEAQDARERSKPNIFAQLLDDQKQALAQVTLKQESARAHAQQITRERVEARSPEDQALRDAKQRILRNLRDQAAIYQHESSAIEAEIKARMELFGESRRKASKAVNAKERLADLNNAVPGVSQGAGGGGNGPLGSAFANIRGLLGRYSAVAQAFQALRASGPFLAVGLAVHEAEQISSAWLKTADAVRAGKISAGEASDEFARAIPVVGSIYAFIQDTNEALTGEKAAIRLVNENLDESRRRMRDAAAAAAEWNQSLVALSNQKNQIGLGNPAADIERQRQERLKAISDAEATAADQIDRVSNPTAAKARQENIEANKAHEAELREHLTNLNDSLNDPATLKSDSYKRALRSDIADVQAELARTVQQIAAAQGEVSDRTRQANSSKAKVLKARDELDEKESAQRIRDIAFQSYAERADAQRKFNLDTAQDRERGLRLAAQVAHDEGDQTLAIEKRYQADSLANANKTSDERQKLGLSALIRLRELAKGFDFGKVETVERTTNNSASGGEEKTVEQKFVPGDAAANRQQLQRVKDTAKSFWQDLTNIWKGGSDEQQKIDEQRKEDRQRLLDQDADQEFRHQQHIKDLRAAVRVDHLKAMGLDFEAGVAERKRAEDRELDEIKQHLKEQLRVRKDAQDELRRRAEEDIQETRKAFAERNRLAVIEDARRVHGVLPGKNESLTDTGFRQYAQQQLTYDLRKARLMRGGLDEYGNPLPAGGSSGGDFGTSPEHETHLGGRNILNAPREQTHFGFMKTNEDRVNELDKKIKDAQYALYQERSPTGQRDVQQIIAKFKGQREQYVAQNDMTLSQLRGALKETTDPQTRRYIDREIEAKVDFENAGRIGGMMSRRERVNQVGGVGDDQVMRDMGAWKDALHGVVASIADVNRKDFPIDDAVKSQINRGNRVARDNDSVIIAGNARRAAPYDISNFGFVGQTPRYNVTDLGFVGQGRGTVPGEQIAGGGLRAQDLLNAQQEAAAPKDSRSQKDTAKHTDETTRAVNKLIEYMKIRFGQGPATFNQSQPALTPN